MDQTNQDMKKISEWCEQWNMKTKSMNYWKQIWSKC